MSALKLNPWEIHGPWAEGFTLDEHISSSEFLGYDANGRAMFETTRTEIGEAVYQLKYASRDEAQAMALAETVAGFITERWRALIDVVVPVPSSRQRAVQPVPLVAKLVAERLGVRFVPDAVTRTKQTPQLKDLPVDQRAAVLEDAHSLDTSKVAGQRILLLDDLYQSGATMSTVAAILMKAGARSVYAVALTRTKKRSQ